MRLLSRCSRCTLAFLVVALSACGDDQGHTSPTETVAPTIAALTLSADSVLIGGSNTPLTVTIDNPAPDRPNVTVEGYLTQGTARRAAGSMQVDCGSGAALLPKGTCTVSFALGASNGGAGTGTLVQGAATFELQLIQNGTVLDTKSVAVTLVERPTISALTLSSDSVTIDGPNVNYTAALVNPGSSYSNTVVRGYIHQGSVQHVAGGTNVLACGGDPGVLPKGTCPALYGFGASNSSGAGPGLLVQGAATFELRLTRNDTVVLDTKTVAMTLVSNKPPTISALTLSSDTATIGGSSVTYMATIQNTGPALTQMLLQTFIVQGAEKFPAGGRFVDCGIGAGALPSGTCTVPHGYGANFNYSYIPGPATLEVQLKDGNGTIVDTKTAPVVLKQQ
jgi:hypothetical protein